MNSLSRANSLIFATFAVLMVTVPVKAGPIIYDNGGPSGGGLEATQWIQASDFTLAGDAVLASIHFWALELTQLNPYQGSVSYFIYGHDAVANTPDEGNIVTSGFASPSRVFLAPSTSPGQDFYTYDFSIAPLALAAGTYWLGLHNGPVSTTFRAEWYWAATDDNATLHAQEDSAPFDGVWAPSSRQEHAFYLAGPAVPEPGNLLLLAIGFAGFTTIRGRMSR